MYKLAIIDDEPLIQLGLHSLIHYKELSLIPCDFVNTGSDALTLIKNQRPDIVLLDIAMPNMDGIDVMRRIQEESSFVPLFLILTNYNDFSYARTALRLGAVDFITKIEVNETVLNTALQKAIQKLYKQTPPLKEAAALSISDAEERNTKNSFFDKLLNNCCPELDDVSLRKRLAGYGIYGQRFGVVCFRLNGLLPEENNIRITAAATELLGDCMRKYLACYVSLWTADSIVCVLGLTDADSPLEQALTFSSQMIHRYTNRSVQIGVGSLSCSPSAIPSSFSQSRILCRRAQPGGKPIYFSESEMLPDLEEAAGEFHLCAYREDLMDAFLSNSSEEIIRIFDQIAQLYLRPGNALCHMLSICFSLFHFISTLLPDTGAFAPSLFGEYRDPVESIRNIKTQEDVERWIFQLRDALCSYLDENLARSKNLLVSGITDYIDRHASEPLTLQKVADAFDKSPTYISTIFKKYSNVGFAEYVRNAKLEKAKELLAKGYKIRDVADMLEYSDPYYFSRVFKKVENMSPSEYIYSLQAGQSDS